MCRNLRYEPLFEIILMFIFLLMILGKTNCFDTIFVFKQQVSKKFRVIYWTSGLDHYQNGWLLVQVSSPRKKTWFCWHCYKRILKSSRNIWIKIQWNMLCILKSIMLHNYKGNNKRYVSIPFDIICNMHQGISIYWMVKMTYFGQHA